MTIKLSPYFVMNGNAKEAIEFYEQALGAKVLFMEPFKNMPDNPQYPLPKEAEGLVARALVRINSQVKPRKVAIK